MENQPTTSRKSIMLNYGLLLGFVSIVLNLVIYIFDNVYEPHWIFIVISLLASTVLIILGIKKLKDSQGGLLSLGDALKTGLGIALISAVVYGIYLMVFFNFIETDFFDNMLVIQEQQILERYPNLTDEQLEAAKKNAAMFANAGVNLTMTIIISLFVGLIISLIGGLVMKKSEEA